MVIAKRVLESRLTFVSAVVVVLEGLFSLSSFVSVSTSHSPQINTGNIPFLNGSSKYQTLFMQV